MPRRRRREPREYKVAVVTGPRAGTGFNALPVVHRLAACDTCGTPMWVGVATEDAARSALGRTDAGRIIYACRECLLPLLEADGSGLEELDTPAIRRAQAAMDAYHPDED